MRQGLGSQSAHIWAIANFVFPLKQRGPPKCYGLCRESAHFGATDDFVPRSKALRTPHMAGVFKPSFPFVGHY